PVQRAYEAFRIWHEERSSATLPQTDQLRRGVDTAFIVADAVMDASRPEPDAASEPRPDPPAECVIRAHAGRDEWCDERYCNHPERPIKAVREEARGKGWRFASDVAFLRAVESHCRANGLLMPRRKGTPKDK